MPRTRRRRPVCSSSAAKPAIIPACVEPVTVQTTIVSKKTPSSCSCGGDLEGPVGEAEAAERVLGGPGRDGVRRAAGGLDLGDGVLPRRPDADVEAARVQPHVGAHDPREQDVADLVVDRVVPVDPPLLDQPALQAEVRRDRRHLPGVVGLVRRRSRPGCPRPAPARPGRCTPACGSCCRRRPGRSCSPRAWPRRRRRRGARSAGRAGARGSGRRSAGGGGTRGSLMGSGCHGHRVQPTTDPSSGSTR